MSAVADLEIGDSRVEFMADYVIKTLKCKPDRWMKMYNIDENKQLFLDWFDKPDHFSLVIINNAGGSLSVQYEWPTNPKQKACYFVKKSKDGISRDVPFRQAVLYGDLSYSPLDQLSAFVDEVLVPLLSNDRNHDHWPGVVSKDVTKHVNNLKSNVYVVSGQAKGKTLLPLPVGCERISELMELEGNESLDRLVLHAIESMVIEWTHQIQSVLKKDSAQPLLEGLNPSPFVEIEFWKNKASNLECIYEQLRDPKVRKMAELLEKTNSSYFATFKAVFRDVVASLGEAQDINMYLKPLRHHFEDFEQAEFDESKKLLAPMMNCLCLVWAHSEYYNTPARIIVLLQEICNMIINMATNFLEPAEIFKGEVEETIDKVRKAFDVLKAFKETYEEHRLKLNSYFKEGQGAKEWEFAPKLVFHRYDKFLDRVGLLKELMETVVEFSKLEKIELGGIKGKVLSQQVVDIFEAFQAEYKVFTEATYDSLDPNDPSFTNQYQGFKEAVADFDRRLATIICQGFDDCSGLESYFKVIVDSVAGGDDNDGFIKYILH